MTKSGKEFHSLITKGKKESIVCVGSGYKVDEFQIMTTGGN